MHITCVVGARPNFMKVAPILAAAAGREGLSTSLVHTGQHYDQRMSQLFFEQLQLPEPDFYLGVGAGNHATMTAGVMVAFDRVVEENPTDCVLVVGDVNSTLACTLVGAKREIPVAHVEAGLRSGDRSMPEELNRIVIDQLSNFLFTSERTADENLVAEGIGRERIFFVGNVMIDTLLHHRERAMECGILEQLGLAPSSYALCTLHRPSNVDTESACANTAEALHALLDKISVVLPLHPRTRARMEQFGYMADLLKTPNLTVIEPQGYLEFLALLANARLVFTDSGGVQEETTALGVPCLTFRNNTERPVTLTQGTNRLVGTDIGVIKAAISDVLQNGVVRSSVPEGWDGKASVRVVETLLERL